MRINEKKYIILGSLCALLLTLAVGYAAFQTNLKVKGTSNIGSDWNVKITNIEKMDSKGATDNEGSPSYDNTNGLSATFNTNFTTPGDYATYKIEITNNGSMDATLKNITIPENTNNDIIFYLNKNQNNEDITESLKQNDTLFKKGEMGNVGYLYVTVLYKDYENQTSPTTENKSTSMTITFDFEQAEGNMSTGHSIMVSKNDTVNLTVEPDTESAKPGETITFTVPTSSEYTYIGSYIYADNNEKIMELDNTQTSFIMPDHNIRIAPIFKYNNLVVMEGSNRDTNFTFKNIRTDATSLTYNTDYTSHHVLTLMSDLSGWTFGGLYSTKKYDFSKYSKIVFNNNAEIISGTTSRHAYFGVVKDINKGLAFDTSNKLQIARENVSQALINTEVNIDELQNDPTPYHIGIEYSTANIQSNLYIWKINLIGRTYYS